MKTISYYMLKTYFKIALRNLLNQKLHTLINMTGLALGIASVFFMAVYIQYEWSYDKYLDNYENLYRVVWISDDSQTRTPHPMAQAMKEEFPEVESAVTLSPLWAAGLTPRIFSVRNLEKNMKFDEASLLAVDSTFFDVFPFPVVRGDAREALRNINSILISESMAKKYFGTQDPIGRHLAVNSDFTLLEVMAVFKDVPQQSHFHFDFLISYVREKSFDPENEYYKWVDFGHFNYVRLRPQTDPRLLEAKIMDWSRKYVQYLVLLLKDFTKLILIAIVLATPFAWWMMDRWLNNFAYKIEIHPLVFVCTGFILLTVSWLILGYLTLRTSRVNPTEVLRNE